MTVSHQGYLKRTPISIYRQQRRGGTGRTGMKTREEDFVAQLIVDSTHAFLLCFTNTGRVYWLKVYEIPDVGAAGKGKSMQSLLDLQPGENVRAILPLRDLEEEGKYIFFATQKGTVKKTPLKDFSNVMSRGIIAIGIDDEDELVKACITDGNQIVFLATHLGMAIRFDENDVRSMGRPAYGVRGIDLAKNDFVVGVAVTPKEHEPGEYRILAITENGFGKRTNVEEYRLQTRGGKGVKNMAVTPRIGRVNTIQLVDDTSEVMVISQWGKIIRIDTKQIRAAGRATQGVHLLNLEPEDKVAAAVIIPPDELNGKDDDQGSDKGAHTSTRCAGPRLVQVARTGGNDGADELDEHYRELCHDAPFQIVSSDAPYRAPFSTSRRSASNSSMRTVPECTPSGRPAACWRGEPLHERGVTAKPWGSASPRLEPGVSRPTPHFGDGERVLYGDGGMRGWPELAT